ncbi:MAG TPA: hypothetical protein VLE93_00375 [Candidatus Saccharimonadales bacterium]|nr:hypothetical protein [Candidatus Saccharimonadales bacterium]
MKKALILLGFLVSLLVILVPAARAQTSAGSGLGSGVTGGAGVVTGGAGGSVGSGVTSGVGADTNTGGNIGSGVIGGASPIISPGAPGFTCPNSNNTGASQVGCSLVQLLSNPDGFVYISWRVVRGAINILLIIALLVISFSNILRINIDTYTIKKALPNLVIGVILANASFLIVKYMADISSVATYFFVGLKAGNAAGYTSFAAFFADVLGRLGITTLKTLGTLGGLSFIASPILALIFVLIALILVLWLSFLFYFRLVAIYLLTILAPLAFIAYGIPGFEKYFKQWWQQFIKWLFILPAMSAVFWLMLVIGNASAINQSFASVLIMYVLFFMALTLPSKMGGAVIDRVSKGFQKYTGLNAAKKFAGEQASNTGKAALARIPGVYRVQEWNKLRKENFEKDLAIRRKNAGTRARGGRAGLREGQLGYDEAIAGNAEGLMKADRSTQAFSQELANRLNMSDIEKTTAEKRKSKKQNDERLRLLAQASEKDANDNLKNPELNRIVAAFAKESSEEGAHAEALKTEESIIVGNHSNERLNVLKRVKDYNDLGKQLDEIDDLETTEGARLGVNNPAFWQVQASLQELREETASDLQTIADQFQEAKGAHGDLAGYADISAAAAAMASGSVAGKLFDAEMKKQAVAYNAGVEGQSEGMRKFGSITQLERENKDFFVKIDPISLQKLTSGRSVGLDTKVQRDFELFMHTAKFWLGSSRNPNYNGSIESLLKVLVKQGKQELKYLDGSGNEQTISAATTNWDDLGKKIESMNQKEKSNLVKAMYQMPAIGGGPADHVQNVPPPKVEA